MVMNQYQVNLKSISTNNTVLSIETYKNIFLLCNEQELISSLKTKLLSINEQDFIVPLSYSFLIKDDNKNYYEICTNVY